MRLMSVESSRLEGEVELSGAKNSALRLLAASLLTEEPVFLDNFPSQLLDIQVHLDMLAVLGKKLRLHSDSTVEIIEEKGIEHTLNWSGRSIRNTLLILGALVGRLGAGKVPLPGGCKLGDRKYDLHVMLLEALGARVWEEDGFLCAEAKDGLSGGDIHLTIRSTGATENAILTSVLAKGKTRVWNPHIRPEIVDLVRMLNSMGAKITVYGQEHILIEGVDGLDGCRHKVIPDNMEAITWLVAASITGGEVEIKSFPMSDLEVVMAHLKAAGAVFYVGENSIIVKGGSCYPIEVSTGPHPGINSDVQPILAAWAASAKGESRIVDLRFPGRYGYANELVKMKVNCKIRGDMLHIEGLGGRLEGARVNALDLRAGAALALCGLTAQGVTTIENAWQIERGYERFDEKLSKLGGVCYWHEE